MMKSVAAGLMCLGFATLGVAISRGESEDLIVIDGKLTATEVKSDEAKVKPPESLSKLPIVGRLFEVGTAANLNSSAEGATVEISADDALVGKVKVNGQDFRVTVENGEVVVSNPEGKIVQKSAVAPENMRHAARFFHGPQVVDPETRAALDKLIAGLKEEARKLEEAGKKEEAARKTQSIHTLEALIHQGPRGAAFDSMRGQERLFAQNRIFRNPEPGPIMEEMKKLHARHIDLVQQMANLKQADNEARAKLQEEIAKNEKEIAEAHQRLTTPGPGGGQPPFGLYQPFAPGAPGSLGARLHGGGFGMGPSSEAGALSQKAFALGQAATRLKEAGLEDQARMLQAQAEEFKAKAEKINAEEAERDRAQAQAHGAGGNRFGPGGGAGFGFVGGPPMELHRSIQELHEQIQQLRKEVGELRELLQRKQ